MKNKLMINLIFAFPISKPLQLPYEFVIFRRAQLMDVVFSNGRCVSSSLYLALSSNDSLTVIPLSCFILPSITSADLFLLQYMYRIIPASTKIIFKNYIKLPLEYIFLR